MPVAPIARRVPFTLLESGRARSLNHRVAFGASIVAQVVAVCAVAFGLSRVSAPSEEPLSDRPSFLAPLMQLQPRPVQEQLSYAATPLPQRDLGVTPVASEKVMELALAEKVGGGDTSVASEAHVEEASEVFSEVEVDSAASRDPDSEAPRYPASLMAKGIEGSILATFVVDTNGRPDVSSFIALEATHPLFAAAVRDVLPRMKFRPAKRNNVPVRQQVELRFSFRVVKPPSRGTER